MLLDLLSVLGFMQTETSGEGKDMTHHGKLMVWAQHAVKAGAGRLGERPLKAQLGSRLGVEQAVTLQGRKSGFKSLSQAKWLLVLVEKNKHERPPW